MYNELDALLDLTTEKRVWCIRVRAQAIWKGINRRTNEFRGINIIFIDDQSCRIHAFITEKLCDAFAKELKEGEVYVVSNFKVATYNGEEINRAVRNQKHIYFENNTNLKHLTEHIGLIKEYAFDLFSLQDVPNFLTDKRFLIDVVGMVNTSARCVFSKEDTTKSHMKFKMTDGRNEVNVTFFNEFGQIFEKALKDTSDEQVVVIIASAKVNKYEATRETYLTNYPATRFYINPKHYSVEMLQRSLTVMDTEEEPDSTIYTIKQIKEFTEEYLEKKVLCHVTVKKVEEDLKWYDNVHIKCDKEVSIVDGRYRCSHCNRNLPYPDKRFKLCTICADNTGFLPIIFPDEEIQRLIGKDVYELENENREAGDEKRFPPILREFQNKEFILTLSPSEDNVKNQSNVYIAKKVDNPKEMLGTHNPSEPSSPITEDVSKAIDSAKKVNLFNSPPTGKSTNCHRGRKNKSIVKCELQDEDRMAKVKKS